MKGELVPGGGGWALYQEKGTPLRLFVKFGPDAKGRLRFLGMTLERYDGERIDAVLLRTIKPGYLESLANSPAYREAILGRISDPIRLSFTTAAEIHGEAVKRPPRRFPKLPTKPPYPRSFYEAIANLYGDMSAREIAEHYGEGVDEGRVYGWIQSARERGLLEGE